MNVRPPRRKRNCKLNPKTQALFPTVQENASVFFIGRFNGFTVIVEHPNDSENIFTNGFYGKGCFSRSFTIHDKQQPPVPNIVRRRQLERRQQWMQCFKLNNIEQKSVVVVPDSDSEEVDEFFNDLRPESVETFLAAERLYLSLEEAYFLMSAIKCLHIYDINNEKLDEQSAWRLFCEYQCDFVQNYVVYYYFRTRNWVVKCGLKFGGDFLLYHKGPPFYHASYLVIIDVLKSGTFERDTTLCRRSMDWTSLIGLNRLAETAAKELLICQVIWSTGVPVEVIKSICNLKLFSVNPVRMRRWAQKRERNSESSK